MNDRSDISTLKAWLMVLVALLDDIAALVLVYIVLRLFDVKIPLPVLIASGLVLGTVIFLIHKAVVPSLRRRKMTGADGMMGLTGKVTQALKPAGVIKINGEYWKAKSADDIEINSEVEVVGINGLMLEVKRKTL